jgi:hypothetical protein
MNELNRQVRQAQRRLNAHRWLRTLAWSTFATLFVAVIGLAIPKIWPVSVDQNIWLWSWLGGAVALGFILAGVITYMTRTTQMEAAIEIDRRFGLKERVSSSLALSADERNSAIGRALVSDAARRAERVDVAEKFTFSRRWWNLSPVLPAIIVFVLAVFVPDAVHEDPQEAQAARLETTKQIQRSTEALKKKLADRRQRAVDEDLKEAGELFDKLEKGVEKLHGRKDVDKKKAMVKLNDLAQEIKKRRAELGNQEEMQKRLNQLRNLKQGPADRLAKAMKAGKFDKALKELDALRKKLESGNLSDAEKQQMAEQMEQMAETLKSLADAHDAAKQELQRQIEEQKKTGNMANAGELQRKLDKMNSQSSMMDQMRSLAQKMGDCSKCMAEGDPKQAGEQLQAMVDNLQALESELEEMEMLDDVLDQIAQARDAMNCSECGGEGCSACQGMGNGFREGPPGMGLGEGRGFGDRPEAETDSNFYNSRVRGEVRRGKAVVVGTAGGRNVAGQSQEEIKDFLQQASLDDADPLTGQRLPKAQRNHARQYFDSVREGN